ncbi:FAD-dependent monooxygenase [Flocculibacter collagenilyticus]|uniref:FAD-dependent monooxygenase n=1 Tax=Flocculibacter collagenilyticus TaxID=2744479 RepID=UPI0018F4C9F6|nr:FAD-dependent monooxygenase [Flocculibacter collagenilyticus]
MAHYDVVIVGAGMVGATLANLLAQISSENKAHSKLKIAVVEHQLPKKVTEDDQAGLRVSAISLGSERILREAQAWPSILKIRSCPYKELVTWEAPQHRLSFSNELSETEYLGHIIENNVIQQSLIEQFKDLDVELLMGRKVQSITRKDSHHILSFADESHIKATLLVAADGANSMIRTLAGIGCTGWNYTQHCFVINIETEFAQQSVTWQQFMPSGPRAFLPLFGQNASLIWYDSPQRIQQLKALTYAQLKQEILTNFPVLPGDFSVQNCASFPITRQHANHYYKNGVVLVGDAAHTINPLAGQGVNIGLQDAKSLSTVIANAIAEGRGISCNEVLKDYEKSRRTQNLLMMSAMDLFYYSFSNTNPILRNLRSGILSLAQQLPFAKKKVLEHALGLSGK